VRRQRWDRWQDEMVGQLEPGETPIAAGRALVTSERRLPLTSTYDFVIVTDRRVLWTGRLTPPTGEQIAFAEVTAFAEGTFDGHRYVLAIQHRPVRWEEDVRRWFGGYRRVRRKRTETRFGFSRAGTEAAQALHQAIVTRAIPEVPLTVPEPTRPPLIQTPAFLPVRCALYLMLRLTGRIHPTPISGGLLSRRRLSRTTSRRTPPGQDPSAE